MCIICVLASLFTEDPVTSLHIVPVRGALVSSPTWFCTSRTSWDISWGGWRWDPMTNIKAWPVISLCRAGGEGGTGGPWLLGEAVQTWGKREPVCMRGPTRTFNSCQTLPLLRKNFLVSHLALSKKRSLCQVAVHTDNWTGSWKKHILEH